MINTGAIQHFPVFAYSFLHHKHTCALTKNRNKNKAKNRIGHYSAESVEQPVYKNPVTVFYILAY